MTDDELRWPTYDDIVHAQAEFLTRRADVRFTPLIRSEYLSRRRGCNVYLKLENLQRTGSYKIRGAFNRMRLMSASDRRKGIVTASAGNHAQGVAYAATALGFDRAFIFMPKTAPERKITKTKSFNDFVDKDVVTAPLRGVTYDETKAAAQAYAKKIGAPYISAFDDRDVIAGQGTVGLEILQQCRDMKITPDVVVVPVGGGGLLSGILIAFERDAPAAEVYGVEAEGAAPFAHSFKRKSRGPLPDGAKPKTIADGIAVQEPGFLTWDIISTMFRLREERIPLVDDQQIAVAMSLLLEQEGLMVEGAGAAALAALLEGYIPISPTANVILVISGGNVDLAAFDRYTAIASGTERKLHEYRIKEPVTLVEWQTLFTILESEKALLRSLDRPLMVGEPGLDIVVQMGQNAKRLEGKLIETGFWLGAMPRVSSRLPIASTGAVTSSEYRVILPRRDGELQRFLSAFAGHDTQLHLSVKPLRWHPGELRDGTYGDVAHVVVSSSAPHSPQELLTRVRGNYRIQSFGVIT